jgi:hypothetical protein
VKQKKFDRRPRGRAVTVLAVGLVAALAIHWTRACGPDFPNDILDGGEEELWLAPEADFRRELVRLQLRSPFTAVAAPRGNFAAESATAELTQLREALRATGVTGDRASRVLASQQVARARLEQFLQESTPARPPDWMPATPQVDKAATNSLPTMPDIPVSADLPGEFADYFHGALIWQNPTSPDKSAARSAWERVLARPAAERKYKSVGSAFMLGRAWLPEDQERARSYFQQTRTLARQGFSDPLGLAAASWGWEAKSYFDHTNYAPAARLYLEQFATGDDSAVSSLRFTIGAALAENSPPTLLALATNDLTRRAVTAYLISQSAEDYWSAAAGTGETTNRHTRRWLSAVEQAGVKDVMSAEMLALAAYRGGDLDSAQRWINVARSSPTAQWLQAKLLLRAGKLERAARLIAEVCDQFPTEIVRTNPPKSLAENLFAPGRQAGLERDPLTMGVAAGREVRAELGALKLARRDFVEALDALLTAGFWADAAYVAERVLTTEELKSYVESHWPAATADRESSEKEPTLQSEMAGQIRHLLARRLTRERRAIEAREFYPANWRPAFDAWLTALQAGQDESRSALERGRQLFAAAIMTRTNGMDLIGTEVSPDWRVYGGDFEGTLTIQLRTNESFGIVRASESERQRADAPPADPDQRFHYRWQAAYLGWAAAQLLPDNSEETALILCRAGTWLKNRDLDQADIFYKALVNRCRKTPLGVEADRIRWFPRMDQNGQWLPRPTLMKPIGEEEAVSASESSTPESNANTEPAPPVGAEFTPYVVRAGDTLLSIARARCLPDHPLTVKELVAANPEVRSTPLRIGQVLQLPERTAITK